MGRFVEQYLINEEEYEFVELLNSNRVHIKNKSADSTVCSKKGKLYPSTLCKQHELCDHCHAVARKLEILLLAIPVR